MDISLWFLLWLGVLGWVLMSSAPESVASRNANRTARAQRRAAWAAEQATARAMRQQWRRDTFGSHPHLYWSLAWFGVPVLSCLTAILMGW